MSTHRTNEREDSTVAIRRDQAERDPRDTERDRVRADDATTIACR
jgi:hypothetical protein